MDVQDHMKGRDHMKAAVRRILRAGAVALVAVAVGPVGSAMAAVAPTITSPSPGSVTNATPSFSGTAEEYDEVSLEIFAGTPLNPEEGTAIRELATPSAPTGNKWSLELVPPAAPLPPGTYTAIARQDFTSGATETPLRSSPVTFEVNTAGVPRVVTEPASSITDTSATLNATVNPNGGSVTDCHFEYGTTIPYSNSVPCASLPGPGTSAVAASVGGLSSSATYHFRIVATATGTSLGEDQTFTVVPVTLPSPPGPPPLVASFSWFPAAPLVGQSVSLVSTSTDSVSPLTGFAWAPAGSFHAGGPLLTTSFSTPGGHVVQLRVTDANGLSSVATQTIHVTLAPLILMQPFPIVRIAGSETLSGVRLRLLTALAPIGSRVTVSCRGRGCPAKSQGQIAVSRKRSSGTVIVEFRQFERSLRAGVILEIRITRPGQIGKFTRFVVRRGKLPVRTDTCLDAAGVSPLACPTS